jgi:hypothetical protein
MNNARRVKGMDAIPTMISVTRINVRSYGALKSGRKGIGKSIQIHMPATIDNSFHLFRILCSKNDPIEDSRLFLNR